MRIEVLGSGCASCKKLEAQVREVVMAHGIDAEVVHVDDLQKIMSYGILRTPGLVVDGVVKSAGRMPNKAEIAGWLGEKG